MASKTARSTAAAFWLTALLFVCWQSTPLNAQGCSQCRDNVSQTNPEVQASYRKAICLMLGAVGIISVAAVTVVRRLR